MTLFYAPTRQPLAASLALLLFAAGCGEGTSSDGNGGDGGGTDDGGTPGQSQDDVAQLPPEEKRKSQVEDFKRTCEEEHGGKYGGTLSYSGAFYCMKGHADCKNEGADCPLYVTSDRFLYFDRVDQPEQWGKFITVYLEIGARRGKLHSEITDEIRDKVPEGAAELPRVIFRDHFAGVHSQRIYLIGYGFLEGFHVSKLADENEFGSTLDVYAASVASGGCGFARTKFDEPPPIVGNIHALTLAGLEGGYHVGNDLCESSMTRLAENYGGCEFPDPEWESVSTDDPYVKGADGSGNVIRLNFGKCNHGEVVAYGFRDETDNITVAKKHFDPPLDMKDVIWNFLEGKKKESPVDLSMPQ